MKKITILFILSFIVFNACENIDKNLAVADKYKENSQYIKAKEIYEQIIKKYPNSDKLNIVKENLQEINLLIENEEINKLLEKAKNSIDTKKYHEANKIYEKILQEYPNNKNIESIKQAKEENDKALFEQENPLGYGYNDAKWEMTKKEVKQIINKKVIKETKDEIVFRIAKGATLECYFFKDRFYQAIYKIEEGYQYTKEGILNTLCNKYGTPSEITNIQLTNEIYLPDVYIWRDKFTLIRFNHVISNGYYLVPDKTIVYSCDSLFQEKENYDNELQKKQESQRVQKEVKKVKELDL